MYLFYFTVKQLQIHGYNSTPFENSVDNEKKIRIEKLHFNFHITSNAYYHFIFGFLTHNQFFKEFRVIGKIHQNYFTKEISNHHSISELINVIAFIMKHLITKCRKLIIFQPFRFYVKSKF